MYVAKCFNKPYREKPIGVLAQMWEKILIGFSLIILVIGMIAGPLLLFSNLNPASVQIKAASGIVEMSMNVR